MSEEQPKGPWKITRIDLASSASDSWRMYPFHVVGMNYATVPPRSLSWTVPDLSDEQYDLSGAVWSAEASAYAERFGAGNKRAQMEDA